MAQRALRPCCEPGCRAVVPSGRCAEHRRKRERERGSASSRGYDSRWQAYRRAFLNDHPLCDECAAQGRTVAATVVDHRVAHKGDPVLFWDPKNHRGLCKPCHDARVDEGDFGRWA